MQDVKSDFYISYWTVIKEPLNISIPSTTSNPHLAVGTPVQVGNMNFTGPFSYLVDLDLLEYQPSPTQYVLKIMESSFHDEPSVQYGLTF